MRLRLFLGAFAVAVSVLLVASPAEAAKKRAAWCKAKCPIGERCIDKRRLYPHFDKTADSPWPHSAWYCKGPKLVRQSPPLF